MCEEECVKNQETGAHLINWMFYINKREEDVYVLISIFMSFNSRNKNMSTL